MRPMRLLLPDEAEDVSWEFDRLIVGLERPPWSNNVQRCEKVMRD